MHRNTADLGFSSFMFFLVEKLVCLLLFLVSKDILNGWLKINYALTRNNLCIIGIV